MARLEPRPTEALVGRGSSRAGRVQKQIRARGKQGCKIFFDLRRETVSLDDIQHALE